MNHQILIVNDNFLIQTINFVGILYGENDNNNLSVLNLEICWNKLQFTGIELKGHRIWFECHNNFFLIWLQL